MKKSNLMMLSAVALAALFALPSDARAAVYADGDLLLGFRATSGQGLTTNYVIDIGQANNFLSGGTYATGSLISLGNFGTDLVNTYGASWNSRSDLNFAAIGAVNTGIGTTAGFDISNTLYLSKDETTFGLQATSWNRATSNTQGGRITANVTTIANGFNSSSAVASTNNSNAVFEDTTLSYGSGASTWQSKMPSFGGNYATGTGLESKLDSGATATALDLFQLNPGSGAGNYMGRFTFDNSGNLSFQTSAVPEPSTYALLALGGLALFGLKRLRNKAQA